MNGNFPSEPAFEHTIAANRRAEVEGLLTTGPNGEQMFGNREVINRDTTDIEGKVDIRSWVADAEALVVDSEKAPVGYNILKEKYNEALASNEEPDQERGKLRAIFDAVDSSMDYDLQATEKLFGKMPESKTRKVNLGAYVEGGLGVRRHMALAAAWLGGDKVKGGELDGKFTAEVNQQANRGAHEWARYTAADGTVYILDPAQKFFGTLDESRTKAQWEYFRPGEKQKYVEREMGEKALDAVIAPDPEAQVSTEKLEGVKKYQQLHDSLREGYSHMSKNMQTMTEKGFDNFQGAVSNMLRSGASLIDKDVEQFDRHKAAEMLAMYADNMATDLQTKFGINVPRIYRPGMISTPDQQRQWFARVSEALASVPAADRETQVWKIHKGMSFHQLISAELRQQVGNTEQPQAA